MDDLGINEENIKIFFSGNEGFHIYVHKSEYESVGSRERAELSDYIMFRGGIPETFGFKNLTQTNRLFQNLTMLDGMEDLQNICTE